MTKDKLTAVVVNAQLDAQQSAPEMAESTPPEARHYAPCPVCGDCTGPYGTADESRLALRMHVCPLRYREGARP